jgi:hypothetical protein
MSRLILDVMVKVPTGIDTKKSKLHVVEGKDLLFSRFFNRTYT